MKGALLLKELEQLVVDVSIFSVQSAQRRSKHLMFNKVGGPRELNNWIFLYYFVILVHAYLSAVLWTA